MQRFLRQQDLVPTDKITKTPITIVGAGGIGHQLVRALSIEGVQNITLWDADKVEEHNMSSQGYGHGDIGRFKVEACSERIIEAQNTNIKVYKAFIRPEDVADDVLFLGVDSMLVRKNLYEAWLETDSPLLIDGRMSAFTGRMCSATREDPEYYASTLYTDEEAVEGSCTTKSTFHCAYMITALMCQHYWKWLNGDQPDKDLILDLATTSFYSKETPCVSSEPEAA